MEELRTAVRERPDTLGQGSIENFPTDQKFKGMRYQVKPNLSQTAALCLGGEHPTLSPRGSQEVLSSVYTTFSRMNARSFASQQGGDWSSGVVKTRAKNVPRIPSFNSPTHAGEKDISYRKGPEGIA